MEPTPGSSIAERKAQLEIEKLTAELESVRLANRPWSQAARYTAVFTALLTALSVGIGLFQFNQQQQATARREEAGRSEELRKTYWLEQKKVYDQAVNAVATIAGAASLKEAAPEVRQFWALYWGGMSLIEGHEVELAMIDFGKTLSLWQQSGNKPDGVENLSYRVAHCMKQSLGKTWRPVTGAAVLDPACPYPE
jgi:hypothetical protein